MSPFQIPDKYEHYYKALDVSNGNILPEKIGNKGGIYLPESVKIATDNIYQKWMFFIKDNHKLSLSNLDLHLDNDENIFIDISKFAVVTYSPIPYLASALAISVGKAFDWSPLTLMYGGRLANLFLWLFVVYFAIKITPVFKWGFMAIALMPMTLFQSASLSADSLAIALSFLIIALFLNLALNKEKKINRKDIFVLLLVTLLLTLSKLPYFLLLFLFFIIPSSKFGSRKKSF